LIPSPIIALDVYVDNHKLEGHLDTGNPGEIDIPYSLKDDLKFTGDIKENGFIEVPTAKYKKWTAQLNGIIQIGNVEYKNPVVNLIEGFTQVNFGSSIARELLITIDKKNGLIRLQKNPDAQ